VGSLLPESVDVAAGLVFVYLFMSILATIGREALEALLRTRAKHLEKGLSELLCEHVSGPPSKDRSARMSAGNALMQAFYEHPLIMSLYRGRYTPPAKRKPLSGLTLPSYIPSGHFAYVVLDLLAEAGGQSSAGELDLDKIAAGTATLDNKHLAKMVQFALNSSNGDIDKARSFLESWFNATMDRVSGWYRRETQTILFWISLVACVVLNVNTVVIADNLYRSPSLRKTLEAQAEAYYNAKPSAIDSLTTDRSVVQSPVAADADASAAAASVPAPAADAPASNVKAPTSSAAESKLAPDAKSGVGDKPIGATVTSAKVPSAETPPASKLDKAPPAATLVTGRDIPGLLSKTDPLEKLGLPLGWNTQTITAMHRLFPAAPTVSQAEAQHLKFLGSMDIKAKDPLQWIQVCLGNIGLLWQDTLKAYQDNGQDPTRNALFNAAGLLSLISGWIMTAFAVTLGAPFWFDILSKLMVVRSTMKPGEKGSTDMDGLSAIAAALAAQQNGGGSGGAPAGSDYKPNFSTAAVAGNAGGDPLSGLDPNSRPREP
jgi:hypothetical protein